MEAKIRALAGDDSISNNAQGVDISGGAGNDSISNSGDNFKNVAVNVTINALAGNDSIGNKIEGFNEDAPNHGRRIFHAKKFPPPKLDREFFAQLAIRSVAYERGYQL